MCLIEVFQIATEMAILLQMRRSGPVNTPERRVNEQQSIRLQQPIKQFDKFLRLRNMFQNVKTNNSIQGAILQIFHGTQVFDVYLVFLKDLSCVLLTSQRGFEIPDLMATSSQVRAVETQTVSETKNLSAGFFELLQT